MSDQAFISQTSWKLEDTVVLIASHSGGTFSSLAVSNLLQAFTKKIFVVSSEFDTQVSSLDAECTTSSVYADRER